MSDSGSAGLTGQNETTPDLDDPVARRPREFAPRPLLLDPVWRQGPPPYVSVGSAEISGGTIANADRVVSNMQAGFRACYERALEVDAHEEGSLRIVVHVNEEGAVTEAQAEEARGPSLETVQCILRRVGQAIFSPPQGRDVVVRIPLTLALSKEERER